MLKKIRLKNFRSHKSYELELENTTILIGPNGAGKSNILEAISLLSFCRSFREDDKKSLVNFDSDFANIYGDDIEIFIQKNPRFLFQAKKKGVFKRQSDFVGTLRSVVFSPETMAIITGSPSHRRKFLDILISQADRSYLLALVQYEKIRSERNSLLLRIKQGVASEDELAFWDDELIKHGSQIVEKRVNTVGFINTKLSKIYSEISGKDDRLELKYISTTEDDFLTELKKNRRREIASGHTVVGPHRDDLIFNLNFTDMAAYASRGEIRSAILSLKIAEIEYLMQQNLDNSLILLLDDVFSEFDKERREHLCDLIEKYQTIITTTETDYLSEKILDRAKIVEITNGKTG